MPRKTFNVLNMLEATNAMLADSTCSAEQRIGMCQVLETMLHESGNYNGFTYLNKREVPAGQLPGINEVDLNDYPDHDELYKARFTNVDDSRRRYF